MEQTARIVPAGFCAKRHVNDARYGARDRMPVEGRSGRPCQDNVVFEQKFRPNCPLQYADHNIITLKAFGNICTGEEFLSEYVKRYSFSTQCRLKSS